MQISGRFNQNLINTNISSQKQSNAAVKETVLNANSVSASCPPYAEYVNSYAISFLSRKDFKLVDEAKLEVERTFNAMNIPKKFKITDEQAKNLIIEAQRKAITNNNSKQSGASHGVAGLLTDKVDEAVEMIAKGNIEINRAKTFCGETQLITDLISNNKLNQLRAIAISRPNVTGKKGDSVTPCSICCSNFQALYKKKELGNFKYVQYVIPEREKGNKIKLKIMTLKDLLPQIDDKTPSVTNKNIKELIKDTNIYLSKAANKNRDKLLSNSEIERLLLIAQEAFNMSSDQAGAAVLTEAGEIFKGFKMGPKARMSEAADKVALINSTMNSKKQSKIKVLAIYEKDNTLPCIENLSWFLHPDYITDNFQIVVIKNNRILIRTVEDYMPYVHKCSKKTSPSCDF